MKQCIYIIIILNIMCNVIKADSADKYFNIQLPEPELEEGRPLMQVLKDRKSSKEFSNKMLSKQTLSNLLWAAYGVNRPGSGKRTAPSPVDWQQIDVYVATADGLYLYDAKAHALNKILEEDIRALTGSQNFVKDVPVNLIYVADLSKMSNVIDDDYKIFLSAATAGFIGQNVYLYCASEGLATIVRGGLIDRKIMSKAMDLEMCQRVIFTQSVGYPKKYLYNEYLLMEILE